MKTVPMVIGFLLLGVVALGGDFLFHNTKVVYQGGTTAQGGTGSTAKQFNVYGVNLAAPGANATSSSILNNTGNDLYLNSIVAACEGVGTSLTQKVGTGLASLQVVVSTTTTANAASGTTISTITIATSSATFVQSTSTATVGSNSFLYIWKAGSYLTFNTNATNTAVCTFGAGVTSS